MQTIKIKTMLSKETANELPTIITQANKNKLSYEDFLNEVINFEWSRREEKSNKKKLKNANIPYIKYLDEFDINRIDGITKLQMNQLSELKWIDNCFNLIILGDPGVGKSHIALGLALLSIQNNKKVIFISARELMVVLKTETTIKKSARMMYNIRNSELLIIDDLTVIAKDKEELMLFFDLIVCLYEKASIIITSNNKPEEWNENIKNQKN